MVKIDKKSGETMRAATATPQDQSQVRMEVGIMAKTTIYAFARATMTKSESRVQPKPVKSPASSDG